MPFVVLCSRCSHNRWQGCPGGRSVVDAIRGAWRRSTSRSGREIRASGKYVGAFGATGVANHLLKARCWYMVRRKELEDVDMTRGFTISSVW